MHRGAEIALYARQFRLLADYDHLARPRQDELATRMLFDDAHHRGWSMYDLVAFVNAGPMDLTCGQAVVQVEARNHRNLTSVLEVLSWFPSERLAGIYFAVRPERRHLLLREPAWMRAVADAPLDMEDWMERVASYGTDPVFAADPTSPSGPEEPRKVMEELFVLARR